VGGGPYLEYPYDPPGWTPDRRDFMLAEPVGIDADGMVRVPDSPGLGVALDEEAVAFYAGAVAT
jgi:L-alanine-DL-glutamate epimerase-like enolase superfamily enzyme